LNRELRDLFGLEGSLSNPRTTTRSDATVARQSVPTVDISRITPSIAAAISGASTVFGIPNLTLGTVNAAGSTTTAMAVDSSVAMFGTALPLGDSHTGIVGTSSFAERAGHRHPHPESLMVVGTTKMLTLTDDPTLGALLTSASTLAIGVSSLSLLAPNATNALKIGKYGNISMAATGVVETTMLSFSKLDFSETSAVQIMSTLVANTGSGGVSPVLYLSGTNSGTATSTQTGLRMTMKQNNASASGNLIVFEAIPQSSLFTGTRAKVALFSGPTIASALTGGTITDMVHFDVTNAVATNTFTNQTGLLQTNVFNRGTTRRAVKVANSIECTANHMIVGTSGMGFVVKDTVDANYYMISTAGGVVGCSSIGTSLPAV